MREVWKPVPAYEDLYEVSNKGRVRRIETNHILKPLINTVNGYAYVQLSRRGKAKAMRIHVIVMAAFNPIDKKPGYDKDHTIDHIDGIKTNNDLSNLEWCSQSENQKRAFALGLNPVPRRKVIDLDLLQVYDSVTAAALAVGGKNPCSITKVCTGYRSHYRGHHFAYLSDYQNGCIPAFSGKFKKGSCEKLWR